MPRCLLIRRGGIGDHILASSVLPGLKKAGFEITACVDDVGRQVLLHDPHISHFLEYVEMPTRPEVMTYHQVIGKGYDFVLDLNESLEGTILTTPDRPQFYYPYAIREQILGGTNYLERTHDIAGLPHEFAPAFYPTQEETDDIAGYCEDIGRPIVGWALTGSSPHKTWPYIPQVVKRLLDETDCRIALMGAGENATEYERAIVRHCADWQDDRRLAECVDLFDLRSSLTFTQQCDVVVGPETGLLHAVCNSDDVGKIIYLSHSGPNSVTKHWKRTWTIVPDESVRCFPCYQMHEDWTHCYKGKRTGCAVCAESIDPDTVYHAIRAALRMKRNAPADAEIRCGVAG